MGAVQSNKLKRASFSFSLSIKTHLRSLSCRCRRHSVPFHVKSRRSSKAKASFLHFTPILTTQWRIPSKPQTFTWTPLGCSLHSTLHRWMGLVTTYGDGWLCCNRDFNFLRSIYGSDVDVSRCAISPQSHSVKQTRKITD